jgi:hypothetical protein
MTTTPLQPTIRCSFCSISHRELTARMNAVPGIYKMIAGPVGVYICADCVKLCVDVLVEGQPADGALTALGDNVNLVATLTRDLEAATSRVRKLESEIGLIAKSVARVLPGPHAIKCSWCDLALDSDAAAREHVATCDQHPAVIELRRVQQRRQRRAGARRTS